MKENKVDENFYYLMKYIKERNVEKMIIAIKQNFLYLKSYNLKKYQSITNYYNKYKLWGTIDLDNDDLVLIERNAVSLVNYQKDFEWLYNSLSDYKSKIILLNILTYWLMIDDQKINNLLDNTYSQYFDLDLIKINQNEVFVDVGAYTGDTVAKYINTFGKNNYKIIYCYEMVSDNIKYLNNTIKELDLSNVIIRDKAATNINDKGFISSEKISSVTQVIEEGDIEVKTVKIDDDIKGRVTFIKMDIEGGELNALLGLKNKIKKYKPKLAISVYHNNNHLWKIPKILSYLNPKYKFYLRYYGGALVPTEYILYAV
ncbi:MAG: FkbM family methyltransferase [Bacilli bacterium]|nr:FkbM family methyltransferase [Bacilli bacterium]